MPLLTACPPARAAPAAQGQWTVGLFEMWGKKAKFVKAAVHIPCWNSFRWNPLRWRGVVFGRYGQQAPGWGRQCMQCLALFFMGAWR